jgi:hypothetical protein
MSKVLVFSLSFSILIGCVKREKRDDDEKEGGGWEVFYT